MFRNQNSRLKTSVLACLFAVPVALVSVEGLASKDTHSKDTKASSSLRGPFFNHEESSNYTDPYRGIYRQGSDLESHILSLIESAQSSLDIAVQEIRLPHVARALVRKKRAGVKVRVVLENSYNFAISELDDEDVAEQHGYSGQRLQEYLRFVDMNGDGFMSPYEISQRDAIAILRMGHIDIIDDTADGSKGSSLMHHKFVIADSKRLLVTSANFTMSDVHGDYTSLVSRGNANALMFFNDPSVVQVFQREFDTLWGTNFVFSSHEALGMNIVKPRFGVQKPYRGAQRISLPEGGDITVQFSPTSRALGFEASTNGLINRTLQKAQSHVNLALFVLSEQRFADTLDTLRKRFPLDIKVLVEPTFAFQWYSELLDMLGLRLLGPSCLGDQGNRVWSPAITSVGVPSLPEGDFLHHKFGVVDSQLTIFGSQNWSAAANNGNDENLLVIDDARVAQRFEEEFTRLYRRARLGAPSYLHDKIAEQDALCGHSSTNP